MEARAEERARSRLNVTGRLDLLARDVGAEQRQREGERHVESER